MLTISVGHYQHLMTHSFSRIKQIYIIDFQTIAFGISFCLCIHFTEFHKVNIIFDEIYLLFVI